MIWEPTDNKKADTLLIHQNLSGCGWVEGLEDATSGSIFIEASDCFKTRPHRLYTNVREDFGVFILRGSELVFHGVNFRQHWRKLRAIWQKPDSRVTRPQR